MIGRWSGLSGHRKVRCHDSTTYPSQPCREFRPPYTPRLKTIKTNFTFQICIINRPVPAPSSYLKNQWGKMSWHSLPVEIQTHILEALIHHEDTARYASICRAWHAIIEPRMFARIKVTHSRLADLKSIGHRHRHLVKEIWFSIEPSDHHCPDCGNVGIPNWRPVSTKTIRRAIQDLVIELSTWEPSSGLVLDISVQAPSALRHSSTTIQYGPCDISEERKKAKILQCSHWVHDPSVRGPVTCLDKTIANGSKPEPRLRKKMPKARAVTSLLLRRQNRRAWKAEVLEELLDLLPEVREIYYEPWRDWRKMEERPTNTSKASRHVTKDMNFC